MSRLDNPSAAADRWASGLSGARQAYVDGVNSVTVAPGQLAAAAADRWEANTVAAKPRYKANSAAVSNESWKSMATSKGAERLASGASAAKEKVGTVFTRLFPAIKSVQGSLPPRGDIHANVERSRAFALGMHDKKGTFKA